jgi:type IV pilus assembly protein PilW
MSLINKNSGFSLIELLIGLSMGLIVIFGVYELLRVQNKTYADQIQVDEMQQNSRIAIDILGTDIRMAGFGFSNTTAPTPRTIDCYNGGTINTARPVFTITNSTTGPDRLTIRYGNPTIASSITNLATTNNFITTADTINLTGSANITAYDYIILTNGTNSLMLQVTAVNGTQLTVAPNTINPPTSVTFTYSVGSLVYKLEERTYQIDTIDKVLQLKSGTGGFQNLAECIEDLQLAYQAYTTSGIIVGTWYFNGTTPGTIPTTSAIRDVRVNILARARNQDPSFTGFIPAREDRPVGSGDHYRRRLYTTTFTGRNL